MSVKKICVASGSRAEFGQLLPLLRRINDTSDFELLFVVTGSHLLKNSGNTISEIEKSGIPISECIEIPSIEDNSHIGIAKQISEVVSSFAGYFQKSKPDLFVAMGDRYEIFGASIAANTLLIPIVHICGGSTTSGAIDEVYRHSITKMSNYHFTTCDVYRKRVIQLGEQPNCVFNVGSLAIENCLKMDIATKKEVFDFVGIYNDRKYCVVTFHPVTLENNSAELEMNELINALDKFKEYNFIITLSNVDSGGNLINEIWKKAAETRDNFYVVPSLGMKRYLAALKYSEMMIGNSSSGTTEGPAMHIPTIDIGDRQKGRFFADSLIHCNNKTGDIVNAINKANSDEFRKKLSSVTNPFGDGNTSQKMVEILKQIMSGRIELKKDFFDVKFEV